MRAFEVKPNPQPATRAHAPIAGRAHAGQSHKANSTLHLQRIVGNQAAQRLLLNSILPAGNAVVNTVVARKPAAHKTTDADLEAATGSLARLDGTTRTVARERLEFAASGLGLDSKALKRVADGLARLARLKGVALYQAVQQVAESQMEGYWTLASDLGDKHWRLKTAIRLVRGMRNKLYWDMVPILQADSAAATALLAAMPPTEMERVWSEIETASGVSAPDKEWFKNLVASGLRSAATGESPDARLERDRGRVAGEKLEKRVDRVAEAATRGRRDVLRYINDAVGYVNQTQDSLLDVAALYADTHARVQKRIQQAKAEAALEQEKMDAILGIAIGVGVGLTLGAAVPLAAGASRATRVMLATAGEVYELSMANFVKGRGRAGADLPARDFEKSHPAIKQVEAYKKCGELYRMLLLLGDEIEAIGQVGDLAGRERADARELAAAGLHRTKTIPEIERRVEALERIRAGLDTVVHDVFDLSMTIEGASIAAKESAALVDQQRMQTQIWIHWMASLTGDDRELPGQEPIKTSLQMLGIVADADKDSVIGWGVGSWHSDDNSRTGVKIAAVYASALDQVGQEAVLIEGKSRQFEAKGDYEARKQPGEGPLVRYQKQMTGTLGRAAIGGRKSVIYSVQVMGTVNSGDTIVITGVIGRNDKDLYSGSEGDKLGPVLIARPKPRSGSEARASAKDDWEPIHSI